MSDGVHALFERQVERSPDAPAVAFEGRTLTYRELAVAARRLAAQLRRLGVGPDALVGLCVERSPEMAIGLLGILLAGGAYVPLDPAYPRDRLAWILEDTRAPVLVTQRALDGVLPAHDAARVYLDDELPVARLEAPAVRGEHLGYVIYTSGSTGRPKGICLPHRALANLIRWHDRELVRGARTLQFASLCFDASFHEMFAAWASGGCVHLISEATRRDVGALVRFLEAAAIEKVILPVVIVQQIAEHFGAAPERFRALRELTTTGEQLHVTAPMVRLFEQMPWCRVHNHYGPSETHVVTAYSLPVDPRTWPSHPPIGHAIDETTLHVLDDARRPVADGTPGELYIGGVMLAHGYLRRPDLTADRFVEVAGERVYKTGDLVRRRPDGELEYLGRLDHQVKIRGHRVELGEIEGALGRHPRVHEAVVLAREDRPGERRLVAYVVAGGGETPGEPPLRVQLRAHLVAQLPDYMIPAAIVLVERMPLTANGKIDRAQLPPPGSARPELEQAYVAPRTALEGTLAEIWEAALGLDRVGALDDFFALGGDSLAAVQVFARIRKRLGVEVEFPTLFAHPTVAGLAPVVAGAAATRAAPIVAGPRTGLLPLSFAQERMWFHHQLAPDSLVYHCPYAFRLRGALDADALDAALRALAGRHAMLRATVVEVRGEPRLRLHDAVDLRLERRALGGDALDDVLLAATSRPFDLARGPLVRAGLIEQAADDHVFWIDLHHIVTDGRSMEVLFRELAAAYAAPGSLAPVALDYPDFAAWQRAQLDDDTVEDLLAWWRDRLAGAPPLLDVPADRPRPSVQSFRGASVPFRLDAATTERLRAIAAANATTLTMAVLAGFAMLLQRYTGQDDLVIGVPSLGRDTVETEAMIGFFVNTLPVRVRLGEARSFEAALREVRGACLDAFAHDALPFERLVQDLRVERSASHNPLVQVSIAPQPPGERDLRLARLDVAPVALPSRRAVCDLTLFCWDDRDGVDAAFEYATDLFDRETIEQLANHLQRLLADLPLLTPREERQILVEWNDTARPFRRDVLFHERIAAHAARTPDAPAVLEPAGRAVSYGALIARAHQLAHHLRALGVGPDVLVALAVDRTSDLVAGMLGILAAGGAFVPVDPAYPPERLRLLFEDATPPVLVTQAHLAERLPTCPHVVRFDTDAALARRPAHPPPRTAGADDLAYVIYTSGSTGRPRGVMVEHRNLLHVVEVARHALGLTAADRVLQFSSPSFDASIWEIAPTLAAGAALQLLPPGPALLGRELGRFLRDHKVTVANLVPSVIRDIPVELAAHLRILVAAGERLPEDLVAVWAPARRLINGYGPTECTVCVTLAECDADGRPPAIGRPQANIRAYVLDGARKPVPIGVAGELYVSGAGVARGYLHQPEATASRFLPDPFTPGGRLYRTGDVARWRRDGQLEFLGRRDEQVKVRGFRIELGEIEAALREHADVREAAVIVREDVPGDPRLTGYVEAAPADAAAHVEAWRALNDELFADVDARDPAAAFTGWRSSRTGEPIPLEEMRAWRDRTVERIAALGPGRVWEIGCGTGLLAVPIAPRADGYLGTDLSEAELAWLRAQELPGVTLERRRADDFRGIEPASFDTVVLNSVVQYFPDLAYLRRVLEGAVAAVRAGGAVFVGDVRDLRLLDAFHAWAGRAHDDDPELVIDPAWFEALDLPGVSSVEIEVKRGREDNELVRFRYDVTLRVGGARDAVAARAHTDLDGAWQPPAVFTGLAGVHPEDLHDLAVRRGLRARVAPGRAGGTVDALFEDAAAPRLPWRRPAAPSPLRFATDPLRAARARQLPARLRAHLEARLPAHMVPSDLVVLDALPLGPNRKIDRRALPAPAARRADPARTAPRTPLETQLAHLWAEVLGVPDVGVDDDFFDLGGHSMRVGWLVVLVQDRLGIELPMRALYEAPTVAALARLIESGAADGAASLCYSPGLRLEDEARLPAELSPPAAAVDVTRTPASLLLTGATGFVGAFLLAELLATTPARVVCLVRAPDAAAALARLRRHLTGLGLAADLDGRVDVVTGDLGRAHLGLAPATYDLLADSVDAIVHGGARVDHVRGYAEMVPANVIGTREILRLACHRRTKPVHFLSTLGTVYPPDHRATGVVREDAPAGPLGVLPNGYMQSKCVGEAMVSLAASRGVPTAIYRLGAITGHSRTGACNPGDFTYSALRTTLDLGFADDLDADLTLTPADFAARALAALVTWPRALGRVFHVTHPRSFTWLDLVASLRRRGHAVTTLSYAACMDGLLDVARRGLETPMLSFLPFVTQRTPGSTRYVAEDYYAPVRWDCEHTLAALTELGVEGPPPPEQLLDVYLANLNRTGDS